MKRLKELFKNIWDNYCQLMAITYYPYVNKD